MEKNANKYGSSMLPARLFQGCWDKDLLGMQVCSTGDSFPSSGLPHSWL